LRRLVALVEPNRRGASRPPFATTTPDRLPKPLHRDQIDTVVMARMRNYWVYSVGLLAAWLIVLSVSTVIKGTNQAGAVYIAFLGIAIG
jgi:hypothetical protein